MTENQKDDKLDASFDSFTFFAFLYRLKLFIILFVVICTGVSVFISLQMDNWYASTANLVPPKKDGTTLEGASGNISSALRNIGLTKMGDKSSGIYSYLVILDSRSVKDSIIKKYNLQKAYEMEDAKYSEVQLAFEDNLDISYEGEGNYIITILDKDPQKAADMVKDYVAFANRLSERLNHEEGKVNTSYLELRISKLEASYKASADSLQKLSKKYSIISPEQQAQAVLKSLSDLKTELIKQEVAYQMMTNRFGSNDPYTLVQKDMYDQLKSKVTSAETQSGFAGNFPLKKSAEIGLEYLRLYAEIETFTKVKAFLLPVLEDARLDEIRNQRNLYIVDEPVPADKKTKPKRSYIVAGTAAGSLVLSVFFSLVFFGFKNFRTRYKALNS